MESFLLEKSHSEMNLTKDMIFPVTKLITESPDKIDCSCFDSLLKEVKLLMNDSLKEFLEITKSNPESEFLKEFLSQPIQNHLKELKEESLPYVSFQNFNYEFPSFVPLFQKLNWENQDSKTKMIMIQHFFYEAVFHRKVESCLIFFKSAYSTWGLQGTEDFHFFKCGFGKNQEGLSSVVCHNYTTPTFTQVGDDFLVSFWFLLLDGKNQDMIGQTKVIIKKNLKIESKVDEKTIWKVQRKDRKRISLYKTEVKDHIRLRAEFLTSGVESFIEDNIYPLPKSINYIPVNKVDYMCYDTSSILKKLNWEKITTDQRLMITQHFFNNYIFKKKYGSNLIFYEKSYSTWRISLSNEHTIEYYFHIAGFGKKYKKDDDYVCESYNPPKFEVDNGKIKVIYWGFCNDHGNYTVAKCQAIIDLDGSISVTYFKNLSWTFLKLSENEKEFKFSNTTDSVRLRAEFLYTTKISQFIKAYLKEYELVNYVPNEITEGFMSINCCNIFSLMNWKKLDKNTKLLLLQHFFNNYIFLDNKEHTKTIFFTKSSYSGLNQFLIFSTDYYFESCGFGKVQETINSNENVRQYSPPSFQYDLTDESFTIYYWTFTISSPSNIVARVKCRITNECTLKVTIDKESMWLTKSKIEKFLGVFQKKKELEFYETQKKNSPIITERKLRGSIMVQNKSSMIEDLQNKTKQERRKSFSLQNLFKSN